MKRIVSLVLVLALLLAAAPSALAASDEAADAAEALYALGLFMGTGTPGEQPVFELDRAPTRSEAVTMLVRLLGRQSEALAGAWELPFTDLEDWERPYVGYAYANGLTTGTGAATFGGGDRVTATEYLTFVLRALGYSDGAGDFRWDRAWELSDRIGLTRGEYSEGSGFLRGDAAIVSRQALALRVKGTDGTLLEKIGEAQGGSRTLLTEQEALAELGQRRLTDAETAALKTAGLETLREKLGTFADFAAWLEQLDTNYYTSVSSDPDGRRSFGAKFAFNWLHMLSSHSVASLAMYLLEDDYPGMGIVTALTLSDAAPLGFAVTSNFIPTENGVLLISAENCCNVAGDSTAAVFPTARLTALTAVTAMAESRDNRFYTGDNLSQVLLISSSENITLNVDGLAFKTGSTGVTQLYRNENAHRAEEGARPTSLDMESLGLWAGFETDSDIDAAAAAAIRQGTLGQAAERIDGLSDLIHYLFYGGYAVRGVDLSAPDGSGGFQWHFNRTPQTVFENNGGNCGGTAGLAARLLAGDYDEVGLVGMTFAAGEGGGHVVNYLRDGERCCIFDPVNLVGNGFNAEGFNFCFGATIEEAVEQWCERTGWTEVLLCSYESTDGDAPVGWSGGDNVSRLIEGFGGNVQIWLETPEQGYVYKTVAVDAATAARIEAMRVTGY